MDLETKRVFKKKTKSSFLLSIWLLLFSLLLTWWLYFYNQMVVSDNEELINNIETKKNSISELEKDENIVISSIYNSNKGSISKLEDYSKLTLYIEHLLKLSNIYWIEFKWFNYSAPNLTTTVLASSDSLWINYEKIAKFIKEYRENEDLSALFDLWFVNSVSSTNEGVDNEFSAKFVLKNNISQILIDAEKKKQEDLKRKEEENKQKAIEFQKKVDALKANKQEDTDNN